jgi:hypothetical protein
MNASGRWIVLCIVVAVVAAVVYLGLSKDEADPTIQSTVGETNQAEAVSSQPLSTDGNGEMVEASQLPRILELGSVG